MNNQEELFKKFDAIAGTNSKSASPSFVPSRGDEIRSLAKQSLDKRSADLNNATFAANTDYTDGTGGDTPLMAGLKSAGNIPSSAYSLGKGLVTAAAHPVDTAKGVFNAVKGSGEALGRTILEHTPYKDKVDQVVPSQSEQTFDALAKALKDRYGSVENAQRTATNDPLGFGSDVLAVLTGGAGLVKKLPGGAAMVDEAVNLTKPVTSLVDAGKAKVANVLENSAQKGIQKVLEPTKDSMKVATQKILPELTSRKKIAFTRGGLNEKVANELEASGQAIDQAWENLPANSKEQVKPIVDAMEESKNRVMVDGKIVDEIAWKAADDLQKVILDVSKDGEIPSESLRKVRQIWDRSIDKSKGFTKDLSDMDKLAIKKEATDSIRKVLASNHPEIADLNKEYTLWKNTNDILTETIKRKTGQSGVMSKINDKASAGLSGFGGGAVFGLKGAALAAGTAAGLAFAMKTTAWRTLSAATKSRLAQYIVEGNEIGINKILKPIIGDQVLSGVSDQSNL